MTATMIDRADRPATGVLAETRALVEPVLRAAVDSLPSAMRHIAGYHFGWWDQDGQPQDGRGGKAVRPALVLAATRAAGGDVLMAVNAAAAVELVHNFTLLHDDVMDADLTRRHRPTAWAAFGRPDAILAGDAVHALAIRVLAGDPHRAAPAATSQLAGCIAELCEGQHDDCSFESRAEVTIEQCLAMAGAKTGALLGCACALGGRYAGAPAGLIAELDAFGRDLGLAFQLIDDLLGIWGDPAITGKPAGADLTAAKKSLPVVAALTSGTRAGRRLAALYHTGSIAGRPQVPYVADLVERAGGRAWAERQAASYATVAGERLTAMFPDAARAESLRALVGLITDRES